MAASISNVPRKGQGLDNTRVLMENLFIAGATNPVQNPRQRGFDSADRWDKLILCFDGTATEPGAQAQFEFGTQAQYNSFYSAFIAQIRMDSGALPRLIEQQTGIDLASIVLADGILATGLPALGVSVPTPGGVFSFNVRLEIPWTSDHQPRVQAAQSPFMGWMFDGGLGVTQGDGVIVNNITPGVPGAAYAVDATAQFTARVEYTAGLPILKVAPYSYMRRLFTARQANTLPNGVYYTLGCTQVTAALPAQAIDSGIRLYNDGEMVLPLNECEPTTQINAWLAGLPGRGQSVIDFTRSTANPATLAWYPVISNPVNSHASMRVESDTGLVWDSGQNLAPAQTVLAKRVPFINEIGEGKAACAGGCSMQSAGYPLSSTASAATSGGHAKGSRTAPRVKLG